MFCATWKIRKLTIKDVNDLFLFVLQLGLPQSSVCKGKANYNVDMLL